ncbi:ABC transporter permease [Aestuariivirga litoralis]|uniref:ABC transporter permease n=1 Tax=Aestuariivirga litoralis TaxID=2650924 RepID=A0A2W2B739_9HYPH|nr:ABC transporter permease [Aestuariivirga litoralis]PZF76144.1 ABC transporter permease [Aestuariivirga litoralis]
MASTSRPKLVTTLLLLPAGLFFVFLLLVPLAVVLIFSFGERAPAGGYMPAFTLQNYMDLPARGKAFFNTLTLAPLGTLLTALFAFPMAYFLAVKVSPKWRVTLLILVMAPFWTSQLLRYYAWMMILGNKGIPGWLAMVGLDVRIINTPWAVLIGAVYGFLPLMVPPIYVSLEKLDKRLLEASADLGATPARTFWQVTLPLALPGVATGSMLVFILLMGDYILPQFLGGGKVFFIGNALVDLFLQSRNWPFGAAVSVALVAIMFVTIYVYMRFVLSKTDTRRAALV